MSGRTPTRAGDLPLSELQAWMQGALQVPRAATEETVAARVEPSSRLSAAERLGIYQRSYILRLLKCLAEQFPALGHALGEELFRDFARNYLRDRPPESYTLYDLGRRFPDYLEETRPDREAPEGERETWIDFMVDLARFERLVFVMFDAPGHEGGPLATIEAPDASLRLQPCFALGEYRFSVAAYYHEVRQERAPVLPPAERSRVAVVRKDYLTHTYPLSPVHFLFLRTLEEGLGVDEALARVAERSGLSLDQVQRSWSATDGIRRRWIAAGFFIAEDSPPR